MMVLSNILAFDPWTFYLSYKSKMPKVTNLRVMSFGIEKSLLKFLLKEVFVTLCKCNFVGKHSIYSNKKGSFKLERAQY